MKKILFLTLCLIRISTFAQDMSYSKPGKSYYQELPNPAKTPVEEWAKVLIEINVNFISDNVRYSEEMVPPVSSMEWNTMALKRKRVI